jgi:hypothetical protein
MTTYTNKHGLPKSICDAVANDPYVGGGDISATKLIDAPQIMQLTRQHKDKITVDVSDRVWSLFGQAIHTMLERAGLRREGMVVEERLFAAMLGWEVSGQYDSMDLEAKMISDYKVTTVYKARGSDSWTRQLNVLRWLAVKNGHEVNRLEVIAIFRDWRKSEAMRSSDYPQSPIMSIRIPVWDIQDTEDYVADRVSLHQAAAKGIHIPCSDEERWASPTKFALMKDGNKRAVRLSDTREGLGVPADGHSIVERKGEFKRCERYCDVSAFCQQRLTEGDDA